MSDVDVDQWLEQWVEEHIAGDRTVTRKAAMHDPAKQCAVEAVAAGISIAELKSAANGDLETYLKERQDAAAARKAGP